MIRKIPNQQTLKNLERLRKYAPEADLHDSGEALIYCERALVSYFGKIPLLEFDFLRMHVQIPSPFESKISRFLSVRGLDRTSEPPVLVCYQDTFNKSGKKELRKGDLAISLDKVIDYCPIR